MDTDQADEPDLQTRPTAKLSSWIQRQSNRLENAAKWAERFDRLASKMGEDVLNRQSGAEADYEKIPRAIDEFIKIQVNLSGLSEPEDALALIHYLYGHLGNLAQASYERLLAVITLVVALMNFVIVVYTAIEPTIYRNTLFVSRVLVGVYRVVSKWLADVLEALGHGEYTAETCYRYVHHQLAETGASARSIWNQGADILAEDSRVASQMYVRCQELCIKVGPAMRVIGPFLIARLLHFFAVEEDITYEALQWLAKELDGGRPLSDFCKSLFVSTMGLSKLVYSYAVMPALGSVMLAVLGLRLPDLEFPGTKSKSGTTMTPSATPINLMGPGPCVVEDLLKPQVEPLSVPEHLAVVTESFPGFAMLATNAASTLTEKLEALDQLQLRQARLDVIKAASQSLADITDAIVWSVFLGIPTLTIYEPNGLYGDDAAHHQIVHHAAQKLTQYRQRGYEVDSDFKIRLVRPGASTMTVFERLSSSVEPFSPDQLSQTGLTVVLMSGHDDNQQSMQVLANLTKALALQVVSHKIGSDSLDPQALRVAATLALGCTEAGPDLLILNSTGGTGGFPLYLMQDAYVYQTKGVYKESFEHKFVQALKAFSASDLQGAASVSSFNSF